MLLDAYRVASASGKDVADVLQLELSEYAERVAAYRLINKGIV